MLQLNSSKYILNNNYKTFKISAIKNIFEESNMFLHNERNKIKKISINSVDFVVKSFKIPNTLNRIIYTFFKDSKAKKSYNNSLRLGDFCPQPVGYLEFYKSKLLEKSFYISENFEFDFTIREPLLEVDFPEKREIFREFAKFCFKLHKQNIIHLDFSPGNILIKKGETFEFKIVDVNRMRFQKLSLNQRALSFAKLWAKEEDLKIILNEYQKFYKDGDLIELALIESQKHKNRVNFKKKIKQRLKK